MTERSDILEMLAALQLAGMRAAYDEIVSVGIKRQHGVERIMAALLKAEIAAKQARSINDQMTIAKLPLVKELADLSFEGTPINGDLITQLATGAFLDSQRDVVLTRAARARATSRSGSAWRLARRACRSASSRRRLSFTSCPKRVTKSGCCGSNVSSPATSC